jgi:TRAP-type C4-dicarboxylate transport system permease small subunit
VFERVLRALALAGGVVLLAQVGMIAWDVLARYVLRVPFLGAYEMTELGMALIVFLALPYCALTGGHVAVDVLARWLDRPAWRWVNVGVPLAGAALTALIAWRAGLYALESLSRGEATNMLKIALWPFQLLGALSMALFAAVLLRQTWKALRA